MVTMVSLVGAGATGKSTAIKALLQRLPQIQEQPPYLVTDALNRAQKLHFSKGYVKQTPVYVVGKYTGLITLKAQTFPGPERFSHAIAQAVMVHWIQQLEPNAVVFMDGARYGTINFMTAAAQAGLNVTCVYLQCEDHIRHHREVARRQPLPEDPIKPQSIAYFATRAYKAAHEGTAFYPTVTMSNNTLAQGEALVQTLLQFVH